MGWRKYFGLERRRQHRHPIVIDVKFYVWNEAAGKPLTERGTGRLVNISVKGGCLQTNTVRIGNHHLFINDDLTGKTPLILEFPPPAEGTAWTLKSQILWYKNAPPGDELKFEFGLTFLYPSPTQEERLKSLIKSIP